MLTARVAGYEWWIFYIAHYLFCDNLSLDKSLF